MKNPSMTMLSEQGLGKRHGTPGVGYGIGADPITSERIESQTQALSLCGKPRGAAERLFNHRVVVKGPGGTQELPAKMGLSSPLDWDFLDAWVDRARQRIAQVRGALVHDGQLGYKHYGSGPQSIRSRISDHLSLAEESLEDFEDLLESNAMVVSIVSVGLVEQWQQDTVWPLDEDFPDDAYDRAVQEWQYGRDSVTAWYGEVDPHAGIAINVVSDGDWNQYAPFVPYEVEQIRHHQRKVAMTALLRALNNLRCAQVWAAWGVVRPRRGALTPTQEKTVKSRPSQARFISTQTRGRSRRGSSRRGRGRRGRARLGVGGGTVKCDQVCTEGPYAGKPFCCPDPEGTVKTRGLHKRGYRNGRSRFTRGKQRSRFTMKGRRS